MKTMILLVVLATISASCIQAAPRKHWYTDPKQLVGLGVIFGVSALDAHSTTSRPPGAIESNPILGRNPSNKQVALFMAGYATIQGGLHIWAWHVTHHVPIADSCTMVPMDDRGRYHCTEFTQDRLGWRTLGYLGVPVTVAIINGHNAARNYEIH